MYVFPADEIEKVLASAERAFPKEASGLLLRQEFGRFTLLSLTETSNDENTPLSFRIRDEAIEKIAKCLKGSGKTICGVSHSHVVGQARPSSIDCAATKARGDLWLIYSVAYRNLRLFEWDGMAFQRTRFKIVPSRTASPSQARCRCCA